MAPNAISSETCSFTDWAWNSEKNHAENYRKVSIARHQLTPEQQHPSLPCSICREDQAEVKIGKSSVRVCKIIAPSIENALNAATRAGFEINTLTGYRVGRTKGPLDARGLRTHYSHHSFGLALDVNAEKNGLYDRCVEFTPDCRLRRGGIWQPGTPGTITPATSLYQEMRKVGLKWGGELQGQQKDFMHFSLQGD